LLKQYLKFIFTKNEKGNFKFSIKTISAIISNWVYCWRNNWNPYLFTISKTIKKKYGAFHFKHLANPDNHYLSWDDSLSVLFDIQMGNKNYFFKART